jgi:two-component system response regulator FixJ
MPEHVVLQSRRSIAPMRPAIPLWGAPGARLGRLRSGPAPTFPVYLVHAERSARIELTRDLTAAGFEPRPFADVYDLAAALPELAPGCVVVDIKAVTPDAAILCDEDGDGTLLFPTILLFSHLEPKEAIAAVRLGAVDLLHRPVPLNELVAALRRAAPKVVELELRVSAWSAKAAIETLTPREREVLNCIMHGLANKEIARRLGISPRTIEMHRANLYRRLSVTSLAGLLAVAYRAQDAEPLS